MNISQHFELLPILSGIFWLVVCLLLMAWYRSGKEGEEWRLFYPAFLSKIVGGLAFGLIYIFYYEGGDTLAYWEGTECLNKLFKQDFFAYLNEMFTPSDLVEMTTNFNSSTGLPPRWIYQEPESFFISKIYSIISIISGNSYWSATIISSSLVAIVHWKILQTLLTLGITFTKNFNLYFLFVPTPLFWCTGVSKDTIVYIAILILFHALCKVFIHKKRNIVLIVLLFLATYLLLKIRAFILAGVAVGILMALTAYFNKERIENTLKRFSLRFIFYASSVVLIVLLIQSFSSSIDNVFNELIIVQQDFANNSTYGDKKYLIDVSMNSFTDIIFAFPLSILAALYRPYIWEALSPLLVLNGLESLLFIFFTGQIFMVGFFSKIKQIRTNEILIFCLFFIMVIGFSIGFTSGLFGVLVRLKSLIIPFMLILFLSKPKKEEGLSQNSLL